MDASDNQNGISGDTAFHNGEGGAGTDHLRRKGAGMMLASLFVLIGCFTGGLSGRRRRKEDVKQSRFL